MAGFAQILKETHVAAVALSGAGFFVRGLGRLGNAAWARARWLRIAPHAVDTVLLLSAVALAWTLRLSPLSVPWLGAKLVGVLVYIGLGTLAMRPGTARAVRALAWVGALAAWGFIVSVAITKDPRGFLAMPG